MNSIENEDKLVTSGIDGVYPPGLPVAQVTSVERNASFLFAKILCKPLAGVNNHTQVLIVHSQQALPERPADEDKPARPAAKRSKRGP